MPLTTYLEPGLTLPGSPLSAWHVQPFVRETGTLTSLHFTMGETQSQMRVQDPDALHLEYTRTMMGFLLFHPQPQRIAMVGLGGGSMAKYCFRHLPCAAIDVVEINPHVIALRDTFHVPPDDARFRVTQGDGAVFMQGRNARYDVLLVDGFVSHGLPSRLCSQDFYDDCRASLRPGGLLVANLQAGHPHFGIHLQRLRQSFHGTVLEVDDADRGNTVVFACTSQHAFDGSVSGPLRTPPGLGQVAAGQLLGAFASIAAAVRRRAS